MKWIDIFNKLIHDDKAMHVIKSIIAGSGIGLITLYLCLNLNNPSNNKILIEKENK